MANQSSPDSSSNEAALSAIPKGTQAALLQAVLTGERYPWAADETADSYDADIETASQLLEISDEEASHGWQKLSAHLSQMWGEESLELSNLQQKFAERLPAAIIAHIGEKAHQLASSSRSAGTNMVEQMVACVQDVLTNVAEADLQVMARPMAFAMRGNGSDEFVEATIKSVRVADWEALSPIEQSRLGLAAARYAIAQAEGMADS